jgi:plasmid maintenance system antidote protein VapI
MEKRKRGKKNPEVIEVHLGKLLSEKIKEQRLSKTAVARSINRPSSAIKPLCDRPSMQAYLLWELSIALDYDFFSAVSQALLQKHPQISSANANDKATIASLQKELADVKLERDYLRKMMDVIAK